jgi:hypothetical protein
MNIHQISRTAIRQIYDELPRFEQQAEVEMKAKGTRALGIVRLDLIKECRYRLEFLDHMVKETSRTANARICSRADRERESHERESAPRPLRWIGIRPSRSWNSPGGCIVPRSPATGTIFKYRSIDFYSSKSHAHLVNR